MAKKRYWIRIGESSFPGAKYTLVFSKKYGNFYGGAFSAKDREELLRLLNEVINDWEGYDSILERNGDKVTPRNLELEVLAPDISPSDVIRLVEKPRRHKGAEPCKPTISKHHRCQPQRSLRINR